jgi:hypothetical protein
MADIMYWAARCAKCSGMVGYRDVRYIVDAGGTKTEERLPKGTIERRCDHCGAKGIFDMRKLRPTSLKLLVPKPP